MPQAAVKAFEYTWKEILAINFFKFMDILIFTFLGLNMYKFIKIARLFLFLNLFMSCFTIFRIKSSKVGVIVFAHMFKIDVFLSCPCKP